LKTTWGRVPLQGVWPLAPSFDTVGPMARDVAGLARGMALLEPGFVPAPPAPPRAGRFRVDADPRIAAAIDQALAMAEWDVVDIDLPLWGDATTAAGLLLVAEAWETDHELVARHPDTVGADVVGRLRLGASVDAGARDSARLVRERWCAQLAGVFEMVDVIVTPTLTVFPPPLAGGEELLMARCTLPVNLAGVPAVALPVPSAGPVPASIQLVGPGGSEDLLLGAGRHLEAAVSSGA
jgi:amidase